MPTYLYYPEVLICACARTCGSPLEFRAHAMEAKLRSSVAGVVTAISPTALKAIRALPSYQSEMLGTSVGKRIEKTIDLLTSYGNINLVNAKLPQLERDYKALHDILDRGIFTVAQPPALQ